MGSRGPARDWCKTQTAYGKTEWRDRPVELDADPATGPSPPVVLIRAFGRLERRHGA
jgi:hypothetical protein